MLRTAWETFIEGILPASCTLVAALLLFVLIAGAWMWCVNVDYYDGIREGDIVYVVNMPTVQGKVQWYNRITETYCVRIIDIKGTPRLEDYEREEIQLINKTKPESNKKEQ